MRIYSPIALNSIDTVSIYVSFLRRKQYIYVRRRSFVAYFAYSVNGDRLFYAKQISCVVAARFDFLDAAISYLWAFDTGYTLEPCGIFVCVCRSFLHLLQTWEFSDLWYSSFLLRFIIRIISPQHVPRDRTAQTFLNLSLSGHSSPTKSKSSPMASLIFPMYLHVRWVEFIASQLLRCAETVCIAIFLIDSVGRWRMYHDNCVTFKWHIEPSDLLLDKVRASENGRQWVDSECEIFAHKWTQALGRTQHTILKIIERREGDIGSGIDNMYLTGFSHFACAFGPSITYFVLGNLWIGANILVSQVMRLPRKRIDVMDEYK